MRCRGLMFAQELFFEPRSDQAIPQILFPDFERAGNGNVGIEGKQRFVGNHLRERMISEKPVGPASNDDDLRQPGIEGLNQFRQAVEIRIVS